jgi:hypothetical protein
MTTAFKKVTFLAVALAIVATPAAIAQVSTAPQVAPSTIPQQPAPKTRTASPKLLACAQDWKQAKADEAVRKAGWINFWSDCAKRRAAEFPSKKAGGGSAS